MPTVDVKDKVVFVTGANRGIGKSFAGKALEMGASRVYATARDVSKLEELVAASDDRLVTLELDVTNDDHIAAAAGVATDAQILINNSGVANFLGFVSADSLEGAEQEMAVNYFGPLKMARAFASILKNNGGGAIVNIVSVAGMTNFPLAATYSASKAAAHSLTQGLRAELAAQNTLVTGVYPGPIDTDMAAGLDYDKTSPDVVAENVYNALAKGIEDVYPDLFAEDLAANWRQNAKAVEQAQTESFQEQANQ